MPEKAIGVPPLPLWVAPWNVTDQLAPPASPVSVKVTVYVPGEIEVKVIAWLTSLPATWSEPAEGFAR